MELQEIANEMKSLAEVMPLNGAKILKNISSLQFPKQLKRSISLENCEVQVQFTVDRLSENKFMSHLSFSRNDLVVPSDAMKKLLQDAFFGENVDVLVSPSPLYKHIIHMVKLKQ